MVISSFKQLDVWKNGISLVEDIYLLTKDYPKSEQFGLRIQMRKSAVSVPSNIAEGFARNYRKEYCRFLFISLGSCSELETQLIVSNRLGFISNENLDRIMEKIDQESRMLFNLIKGLK